MMRCGWKNKCAVVSAFLPPHSNVDLLQRFPATPRMLFLHELLDNLSEKARYNIVLTSGGSLMTEGGDPLAPTRAASLRQPVSRNQLIVQ